MYFGLGHVVPLGSLNRAAYGYKRGSRVWELMHNTRQSIVEHPLAGMMKSTPSHVLISTESRRSTLPQIGGVELRNAIVSITNVSRVGCSAGLLKRRR